MATLTASPGVERLSKRNLWGYSLGGIGRDMTYQLVNTYLTLFILFTKGLTTAEYAAVGIIFIVCRIFDGCTGVQGPSLLCLHPTGCIPRRIRASGSY